MRCASWLSLFRNRLASTKRPVRAVRSSRELESLEPRVLLTVVAFMVGSELSIVSTGPDSIAVRENPTNPGRVQVLANGMDVGTVSADADSVTAITIQGSDSNNVVDLSGVLAAVFSDPTLTITVQADDGDDKLIGSPDVASNLDGGDGNDTLTGGSQNDTLNGANGADSIPAGAGDDSVIGQDGADRLNGEDGNDTIDAGNGSDVVDGGGGDDRLSGGDGADSV